MGDNVEVTWGAKIPSFSTVFPWETMLSSTQRLETGTLESSHPTLDGDDPCPFGASRHLTRFRLDDSSRSSNYIGFIITVDESIIGAESSDEEEGRTEIASV